MGGKIWGYPIAFEAVGLIYNKKLVAKPPRTFEEIFALHKKLDKDGKKAILWDYNNTYFTFPLLAAQGGYAFKRRADGSYDGSNIGINSKGAIKGLDMLLRLINEGVMPRGASYADMEAGVAKGEIAMMINGPWAWANLKQAGIDFGVAPLPTIGGKPAKPFVGVLGAMINQASPDQALAIEFIENYLLTADNLKLIDDDKQIGVPALKSFYQKLQKDPLIKATMVNVKNGVLMPNNPEMGKFWSAMGPALENATRGRQNAKEALDAAAKRVK
jgi:maltose/maltodextrin transport system substrate-binding protein